MTKSTEKRIKQLVKRLDQIDRVKSCVDFASGLASYSQFEFYEKEIEIRERELLTLVKACFGEEV